MKERSARSRGRPVLALLAALAAAGCGSGESYRTALGRPIDTAEQRQLVERGQELALENGCDACHAFERSTDPELRSLAGIVGTTVTLTDGTRKTRDDAYLVRSIREPSAEIVAGQEALMPDPEGLTDRDVEALIEWIKSLP